MIEAAFSWNVTHTNNSGIVYVYTIINIKRGAYDRDLS